MRDYVDIGAGPAEEKIEQANVEGTNYERMRAECAALILQLKRILGMPPEGASLALKFERDGNHGYWEVVCYYDRTNRASIDYAYKCEESLPAKWDDEAKKDLERFPVGVQA